MVFLAMYLSRQQQSQDNPGGNLSRGGRDDKERSSDSSSKANEKGKPSEHGNPSIPRQGGDIKMESTSLRNVNNNDSDTLTMMMMMTTTTTTTGMIVGRSDNDMDNYDSSYVNDEASMFWTNCELKGRKAEMMTNELLAMKRTIEMARVSLYDSDNIWDMEKGLGFASHSLTSSGSF
jgi:hypothetical protein